MYIALFNKTGPKSLSPYRICDYVISYSLSVLLKSSLSNKTDNAYNDQVRNFCHQSEL